MLNRTKFLQAMGWGQLGRSLEIVLSMILLVVVVRRLDQPDYSTYSLIISLVTFVVLLSNLGLNDALLRFIPDLNATHEHQNGPYLLLAHFLRLRIMVSLGVALLFWGFSSQIAAWLNQPFLAENSFLVIGLYLLYGVVELIITFFSGQFWVKQLEIIRLLAQLGSLVFVILWFWLNTPSAFIIILSLALANIGTILAGLLYTLWRGSGLGHLQAGSGELGKSRLAEIRRFCRDMWLIKLLNLGLAGQIDVLLLGLLASDPAAIGYYNLAALMIARLWVLVIGWAGALNSIIATVAVERGQEGLQRYFAYYYRFNLLLIGVTMAGLLVISTPLVILLFGNRYGSVALLVKLFVIQQLINALAGGTFTQAFLNVKGRQNITLRWNAFYSLLNILLDLLLIPPFGALGAVIATTVANSLASLTGFWLLRDLFGNLSWAFSVKILLGIISGGLLGLLFNGESFWNLILAGLVYVGYIVLFLALVKPLTALDRQILTNLRPRLAKILRYF